MKQINKSSILLLFVVMMSVFIVLFVNKSECFKRQFEQTNDEIDANKDKLLVDLLMKFNLFNSIKQENEDKQQQQQQLIEANKKLIEKSQEFNYLLPKINRIQRRKSFGENKSQFIINNSLDEAMQMFFNEADSQLIGRKIYNPRTISTARGFGRR